MRISRFCFRCVYVFVVRCVYVFVGSHAQNK